MSFIGFIIFLVIAAPMFALALIWWGVVIKIAIRYGKGEQQKYWATWPVQASLIGLIAPVFFASYTFFFAALVFPPSGILLAFSPFNFITFATPALQVSLTIGLIVFVGMVAMGSRFRIAAPIVSAATAIFIFGAWIEPHSKSEMCRSAETFGVHEFTRSSIFESLPEELSEFKVNAHGLFEKDGRYYGWSYKSNSFEVWKNDRVKFDQMLSINPFVCGE